MKRDIWETKDTENNILMLGESLFLVSPVYLKLMKTSPDLHRDHSYLIYISASSKYILIKYINLDKKIISQMNDEECLIVEVKDISKWNLQYINNIITII